MESRAPDSSARHKCFTASERSIGFSGTGYSRGKRYPPISRLDKWDCNGWLTKTGVSVEKVTELILVRLGYSRYKQARVADAAVHRHARRPGAHDGTSTPRGVAVLLLPPRRSGS